MARAPSSSPRPQQAPGRSVEINGRTVTDPRQVERIERNREASARYAVDSYQSEGTPIPPHLQSTVDAQIARGVYNPTNIDGFTSLRDRFDGGGPGQSGTTFQGGPFSAGLNAIGVTPLAGRNTSGTRIEGGQLFLGGNDAWNQYTAALAAADRSVARPGPTPGPNYVAGLGMPGTPREDNEPQQMVAATAPQTTLTPELTEAPMDNLTGEEVSRRNAERSRVPTYEEGGMVGPNGKPIRPSTRAREIPLILQGLLSGRQSYAEGGMVGPGGMPQRPMTSPIAMDMMQRGGAPVVGMAPPGGQGRPLNFAAIDQEAQRFMQQQPQQVAQIRAEAEKAMAEGELDAQALNLFVQVATAALQNPEMWPQLRQALINQDFIDPEDISEEYDQGFLITLYIVGKTMGGGVMAAPSPMAAGQEPQMSMREGGPLPAKSENLDGSIPINAHEGEYVIPADVTRKLGTDHFDKMIAKARGMDAKGEQQ
jgi:hypothetical protein